MKHCTPHVLPVNHWSLVPMEEITTNISSILKTKTVLSPSSFEISYETIMLLMSIWNLHLFPYLEQTSYISKRLTTHKIISRSAAKEGKVRTSSFDADSSWVRLNFILSSLSTQILIKLYLVVYCDTPLAVRDVWPLSYFLASILVPHPGPSLKSRCEDRPFSNVCNLIHSP